MAVDPVSSQLLSAVALIFGTLWIATNFYQVYPLVQSLVLTAVTRTRTNNAVFHLPDASLDRLTAAARRSGDDLESLPTIDVYVPAYKEASIIHQSIQSITETTYPTDLLDLHVLLEPDDEETQTVVSTLADRYPLEQIIVPEGYPGKPNKPRALNYAFERTDGDIVGIMDAENIVEPDVFDRAAAAIVGDDLDYVQGVVDMANESDGWLNLMFRAEYGFWYKVVVPAFRRLNFPLPLSGTTCFFRRTALERASELRYNRTGAPWGQYVPQRRAAGAERAEATVSQDTVTDGGVDAAALSGGARWLHERGLMGYVPWDPTNVTEDFELGLLLWSYGFEFGLINSTTREESPRTVSAWLKQRTR